MCFRTYAFAPSCNAWRATRGSSEPERTIEITRGCRVRMASEAGQAVRGRHPDVQKHDVRREPRNERKELRAGARRPHDFDLLGLLERELDRVQHQSMVVRDHHP